MNKYKEGMVLFDKKLDKYKIFINGAWTLIENDDFVSVPRKWLEDLNKLKDKCYEKTSLNQVILITCNLLMKIKEAEKYLK
jgi:hypothetical protein